MLDQRIDEKLRLRALAELGILDTPEEASFNEIVEIAASVCDVPISLVTLVDADRQWFKANKGLKEVSQTSRATAFCSHTILGKEVLEIRDARHDPRFSDNPLVTSDPKIRFYAGATLCLKNGAHVGSLCVIDRKPKCLSATQKKILKLLSQTVVRMIESRRVTADLAISENRFRALTSSVPIGIFSTTADGACTYTNQHCQAILGLSDAQALGSGWLQNLHPEDRDLVLAQWTRAADTGADFDKAFRIVQPSGQQLSVHVVSGPILTSDGQLTGHVGSVKDITQQVEAEQQLQNEKRRLSSIIDGTRAGTWEWNICTGESRLNSQWAEIVGSSLADLAPISIQTWYALVHPEDYSMFEQSLCAHMDGNSAIHECEIRMRHTQGHWVWVLVRGRLLTRTSRQEPEWMYGTLMDISERKEQQEALRKSQLLLSETGAMADVGGWELDLVSNSLTWTEQTFRIHELKPVEQIKLEEAFAFYTLESQSIIRNAVERACADGCGWDLELPISTAQGRHAWLHSVGRAEMDNGKPVRLIGAVQDITERVLQRQALENAHERISVATESGNIGVWDWNVESNELIWSKQMFVLFGLPEATVYTDHALWAQQLHPEDRPEVETMLKDAMKGDANKIDCEYRVCWPGGSVHHIRSAARITRNSRGVATQILGVCWDVTALRELSSELSQKHELLRVTLQSIGDAVITTDVNACVTWLNPAAEHMTGWSARQAIGTPVSSVFRIVDEHTGDMADSPVDSCLETGEIISLTHNTRLISRNGREFGIEDSAAPIRSRTGQLLGAVLIFHDVSEQRRLTDEMKYRATHDMLTGLVNRAEFESRLASTLTDLRMQSVEHALLYIDLDQFKLVNDACGHSQGDQLLKQIAKLLERTAGDVDTVARLGGDEFALILQNCDAAKAARIAQRICESMEDFRFVHEDRRFRLGTSIGLVSLDRRWTSIESAMQAADASCYAAKEAGRNRVHVWYDTDSAMLNRREDAEWATRLESALDDQSFELHAQLIHPLSVSQDNLCAEILIRMRGRNNIIIYPNTFIAAAERFHLATRIDRWVVQQTINALKSKRDIATVNTLFINLSGQSVGDRLFHKDVIQMLSDAGPDVCRRLCLEITETTAVTNMADASSFISQIRELGVRVALDDFGAGASSFGYLKSLQVDLLKIDGQFIEGVVNDPLDSAAVRCFVDVAKALGLETVAEYVSDTDVLNWLTAVGVDYAQGYQLHRPEPLQIVLDGSVSA